MGVQRSSYLIGFFLFILIMAACATGEEPNVTEVATIPPTATPTPNVVPVATVVPTDTPEPTPTRMARATGTIAPTSTPASMVTVVATATPTLAPTATPIPTPTSVPPTATPVPTPTPTAVPTATPTPTATPVPPTPTPVPTPTPTPIPPLGSRNNPVPLGTTVQVKNEDPTDYWEVTVISTMPDATESVLKENSFNDPPEPGNHFYIVTVRAKYLGPDSTRFDGSFRLRAVGNGGVVYTTFSDSCGVTPNELPDPELFTNGQIEGSECWQIASDDAESLMLFLEPAFLSDSPRVWFSLEAPVGDSNGASQIVPGPLPSPMPSPHAVTALEPESFLGSRDNPAPFGITVQVQNEDPTDHWEVTVISTMPDATESVRKENSFNDPPEPGNQFYIVTVRAKYLGPDSTEFRGSLRLGAVGNGGVVYTTFSDSCGVIPKELPDPELFTNGEIEGNECWQIASDDADSLMMFLEPEFLSDSPRVWFSLTE